MKYCSHCGKPVDDNAVICVSCGCEISKRNTRKDEDNETIELIAKIFMILACISVGWTIVPLLWMIPMTVHVFNASNNHTHIGTGFKVCTLLFVSVIGGIALLCRKEVE